MNGDVRTPTQTGVRRLTGSFPKHEEIQISKLTKSVEHKVPAPFEQWPHLLSSLSAG